MDFLVFLQGFRSPPLDVFMLAATYLADELTIILLLCCVIWCVDRTFALQMGMSYFLSGMINQILKLSFMVPRPFLLDPRILPLEAALPAAHGWSFPSGHTAVAVAMYGSLFLRCKRWWTKALCLLAIVLVGLSRMYLGVHTPMDVLVSLVVGVVLLCFSWVVLGKAQDFPKWNRYILCGAILLVLSLAVLSIYRAYQGYEYSLIKGAFSALAASVGFLCGWWLLKDKAFAVKASLPMQAIKLVVGIVVILLLQQGSALLFPNSIAAYLITFALICAWVVAVYPMILQRIQRR